MHRSRPGVVERVGREQESIATIVQPDMTHGQALSSTVAFCTLRRIRVGRSGSALLLNTPHSRHADHLSGF